MKDTIDQHYETHGEVAADYHEGISRKNAKE